MKTYVIKRILDAEGSLQALVDDEIEAINGYKKAIAAATNPALINLLAHIMKEECEHLEELKAAQVGKFEIEDSKVDDMGMWVPSRKREYNEYNMSSTPDRLEMKLKAGVAGSVDRTIVEGAIREAIGDIKEILSNKTLTPSGVNNIKQVYRDLARQYQGKLQSTNANEALDDLLQLVR